MVLPTHSTGSGSWTTAVLHCLAGILCPHRCPSSGTLHGAGTSAATPGTDSGWYRAPGSSCCWHRPCSSRSCGWRSRRELSRTTWRNLGWGRVSGLGQRSAWSMRRAGSWCDPIASQKRRVREEIRKIDLPCLWSWRWRRDWGSGGRRGVSTGSRSLTRHRYSRRTGSFSLCQYQRWLAFDHHELSQRPLIASLCREWARSWF